MVSHDMVCDSAWRNMAALQAYRLLHGFAALPAATLAPFLQGRSRRISEGFKDYFGLVDRAASPVLWVHGVSMGESMVAAGFAVELRKKFPEHQIAFTTTHPDVHASFIKRRLADLVAYFPLDNLVAMRRIFDRWRPAAVFVAETDFWPEFSWQCRSRNIPLFLINGRISSKIADFYARFPGLAGLVFGAFSLLAVQARIDADRLLAIGVSADRIRVLGNMKADLTPQQQIDTEAFKNWIGGRKCLVLGSLHPAEFAQLKPAMQMLAEHGTALIVAPRNPSLAPGWLGDLQAIDSTAKLRSQLSTTSRSRILLLDTMGELAGIYCLADAAFVGGSLDPAVGGHNPLEVMQQRVPLIMGPHCRNFADIVAQLQETGGIRIVDSCQGFADAADLLLGASPDAGLMVQSADAVLAENRGCLQRTLQVILDTIDLHASSN